MHTQRNLYTHHMLLFGVVLPWKSLWIFYFFEDPRARIGWKLCPVNGKCYLAMLRDKVILCLFEQISLKK